MSNLRSDIRTRVRDYLNESVADLFTDAQLNRYITEELNSLPTKDIYLEEIWDTNLVVDQTEYTLPTGTYKVEKVERNCGTSTSPQWDEMKGWDTYASSLTFEASPYQADEIRIFIKKFFTVPSGDIVALDIPDDKSEILVWGVVIRAYKQVIGYLRGSVSWDTVTKPGELSISNIIGWLRDARKDYKDMVQQYATASRPRDIDLVS